MTLTLATEERLIADRMWSNGYDEEAIGWYILSRRGLSDRDIEAYARAYGYGIAEAHAEVANRAAARWRQERYERSLKYKMKKILSDIGDRWDRLFSGQMTKEQRLKRKEVLEEDFLFCTLREFLLLPSRISGIVVLVTTITVGLAVIAYFLPLFLAQLYFDGAVVEDGRMKRRILLGTGLYQFLWMWLLIWWLSQLSGGG